MQIYPEKKLGMVLMTNGYGIPVHRALHRVCEAICAEVQAGV